MRMNKAVAQEVLHIVLKYSSELDSKLEKISTQCPKEDFVFYRKGIGLVMGYTLTDIMNPIFDEFPDLKPDGLE